MRGELAAQDEMVSPLTSRQGVPPLGSEGSSPVAWGPGSSSRFLGEKLPCHYLLH